MADETLRWKLDVDAKPAAKATGDLSKLMDDAANNADDLAAGLDESATAGKRVAQAITKMAGDLEKGLEADVVAADALTQALGVDGVAAFNKSGKSVDDLIATLRTAGLTTEEIVTDADALAASLRRVNDVGDKIDQHLTRNMQNVAKETDRSRSVMANMVGNAAQELPLVSGAMGPLNVAIGQFAEYAAEGDISLKGIAATAGPMMGVGAAVWYINSQLELMRKKDAFRTDRIKSYEEAIRKGGNAAENLADHLRELGKIETQTTMNAVNPFADATADVTDQLIRAGLSVEDYTRLVTGNMSQITAWADHMRRTGADGALVADVTMTLAQANEDYSKAADNAAKSAKFFGDQQHRAARESRTLVEALDAQQQAWDRLNDELDMQDITEEAQAALRDTEMSARDVKRAVHDYMSEVLRLPASLSTTIDVLIDEGSYAEAEARLARLARMRNTTYFPSAEGSHYVPGRPGAMVDAQDTVDALKAYQRAGGDVPWG